MSEQRPEPMCLRGSFKEPSCAANRLQSRITELEQQVIQERDSALAQLAAFRHAASEACYESGKRPSSLWKEAGCWSHASACCAETVNRLPIPPEAEALARDAARYLAALKKIALLDPNTDSDEGFNEWGETDCFRQAQGIAEGAIAVIDAAIDEAMK